MNKQWEEHVAIPVSNKGGLTPYVFYDYFLPALRKCLLRGKNILISLDMTDIESVSPLVIPNLIIVGIILRKHFGIPVDIILGNQNVNMIRFLYCLGFFKVLDEHNFFTYDTAFVGGFVPESTGDLGILLCVPISELSPEEITLQILNNNRDVKAFLKHFDDETLAYTFARTVGEITHNSMKHGRSFAIICAYGGPKMGLQCAISDCGIGYLASLLEQPKSLSVFSQIELGEQDNLSSFRAIIEAICKRFKKKTYGLSSVIRDITKIGGITRVHSGNTQVVLTKRNQLQFMSTTRQENPGRELSNNLLELCKHADSLQSSPVRIRESKLAGVHIEFEIPPTQSGGGK